MTIKMILQALQGMTKRWRKMMKELTVRNPVS